MFRLDEFAFNRCPIGQFEYDKGYMTVSYHNTREGAEKKMKLMILDQVKMRSSNLGINYIQQEGKYLEEDLKQLKLTSENLIDRGYKGTPTRQSDWESLVPMYSIHEIVPED